ncbi:MAG: YecA family protein [Armatimonadota bacterium]|jgi:uncharacterized protein YecA (UPF0149 family)
MIKFKETTKSNTWMPFKGDVEFTYQVYTGSTKQEAIEFLEGQEVNEPSFYIVVETPEGNWGKDIAGIYDEDAGEYEHSVQIKNSEWSRQKQLSEQEPQVMETWVKGDDGKLHLDKVFFKVGRNDPCPCGSGKKFKHCCMP